MSHVEEMLDHLTVRALRERERERYDSKYFAEHYWREDLPGLTGNRGLSYEDPDHERRFKFLYDALIGPNRPRRLLDCGCGPGFLLEEALAHDIEACGVDSSTAARDLFCARTGGAWSERFIVSTITEIPLRNEAVDLCLCVDVLEHLIVFDIFDAVQELCRVSSKDVVCSINLDNPYEFHPTILSRASWISVFESTGTVQYDVAQTERLNTVVRATHPEYDIFAFRKKQGHG